MNTNRTGLDSLQKYLPPSSSDEISLDIGRVKHLWVNTKVTLIRFIVLYDTLHESFICNTCLCEGQGLWRNP